MMSSAFFVRLPDRGAVLIRGDDRRTFLQGLITNDVALLDSQMCVYSCLLTPQGRFLHDFFMTEQGDTIQLECEGGARAIDLMAALKKFKLRSKIELECIENKTVFAGTGESPSGAVPDPRHPDLGWRGETAPEGDEAPFAVWDRHRLSLGIPDGSRDMEPGRALMLESNIDKLNGLSFTKGCFMGQELTARMHYRALVKKHLRRVHGDALPPPGTDIPGGEMRSSCGDLGLALLRDEALPLPEGSGFSVLG